VRCWPENPASDLLFRLEEVGVGERFLRLRRARRAGRTWILAFEEVSDRDGASALTGEVVWVEREVLPPLDEGHYLWDLVGCEAEGPGGDRLGRIVGIEVGAGAELLVLEHPSGRCLVPAVDAFLASVDLAARRVVLDLPEGLIEAQVE
jgi:16S rRNA processing protein RimM